jgi:hypothetical protein
VAVNVTWLIEEDDDYASPLARCTPLALRFVVIPQRLRNLNIYRLRTSEHTLLVYLLVPVIESNWG